MRLLMKFHFLGKKKKAVYRKLLCSRHTILVWGLRMGSQVEHFPDSLYADWFAGIQQAKWEKKNPEKN